MTKLACPMPAPYALGQFTAPSTAAVAARPAGERFDPERQVAVLPDGTPLADSADPNKTMTQGGLSSPTEQEWSVVFPDSGGGTLLAAGQVPPPARSVQAPYALGLFTDMSTTAVAARPAGERFDAERQVTVLPDGTPLANTVDPDASRTSNGMNTSSEGEMMDVFPDTTAVAGR
ncbi:putative ATP-grasp-modified RiPP [Streptomyces niveus]|uniref:putative ATP-grasp-modified RiPP n=1 Tax=Streptomyces niveus TaxID=193462 RepID=UPI003680D863